MEAATNRAFTEYAPPPITEGGGTGAFLRVPGHRRQALHYETSGNGAQLRDFTVFLDRQNNN
jgi:hypothetical protein